MKAQNPELWKCTGATEAAAAANATDEAALQLATQIAEFFDSW